MSKIEWLSMPGYKPQVWNPVTGCTKVSAGCKNCYAINMSRRLSGIEQTKGKYAGTVDRTNWTGEVFMHWEELERPAKWKKPRMVFVNSMSDLFHEQVGVLFINAVLEAISQNRDHIFLILTKRPERMQVIVNRYITKYCHGEIIPNLWLGVSAENQDTANDRIPHLLKTQAAVRFVSCEPLLGAIDLQMVDEYKQFWMPEQSDRLEGCSYIDWVIVGGESGKDARPMHPDWARSIRDQCASAGVPFFFKQWGEWRNGSLLTLESKYKHEIILRNGSRYKEPLDKPNILETLSEWNNNNPCMMAKTGKQLSGHRLYGTEHFNWPKPRT